jgi:hypothetical protein
VLCFVNALRREDSDGKEGENQMNQKKLEKRYHNVLIYTTKKCNLRCPRCFLADLGKEKLSYSMTKEQFVRIIERLNEQKIKVNWMCLSGGEPTLWPHLAWAIDYAKNNADVERIIVGTNGIGREAKDYGDADVVCITHYGAINRYDILRLRRQLGRKRTRIQYVVHLRLPLEKSVPNPLPADCGCVNLAFVGDKVYPCGMAAGREVGKSISVEKPFYAVFTGQDPQMQELCKTCLSNRKNKKPNMAGLTMEFGVWDSAICRIVSFSTKGIWLRKLYRYYYYLKKRGF